MPLRFCLREGTDTTYRYGRMEPGQHCFECVPIARKLVFVKGEGEQCKNIVAFCDVRWFPLKKTNAGEEQI